MDYEEKYKSALKWMQSLYGGLHGVTKEEAEKYFPELKESNSERIKFLIKSCVYASNITPEGREEIFAWLEKQGEHKPYGQRKECEDCQFNYAGECKGYCALKRNEQPTDKVEYPHWISVEDELPRCYIPYNNWDGTPSDVLESEKVIALLSDGTICIATFNQNLDVDTDKPTGSPYWFDEGHPEDGDRIRGEVTHWMPQPPAVLSSLEIAGKKWEEKKGGEQ